MTHVKENEARERKICPFIKHCVELPAQNIQPKPSPCLGSTCMLWRWSSSEYGYCGAGPEPKVVLR